jgi:threonylcarbamoyladenosine tRNA methylthiotransferase MtaB
MGKRRMKVCIKTFGCKVNKYNSELIRENLLINGSIITDASDEADTIILNSCVVTEKAEKDVLKELRRIKKSSKNIFVTGCISTSLKEKLKAMEINYFNGDFKDLREIISEVLPVDNERVTIKNTLEDFSGRTRAFVKIQSGCNQFCSYCIVPYVRGTPKSRDKDEIMNEIREILNKNYKEIVLTGTQIGLYNHESEKLSDLVEDIIESFPNLKRLRISSIDPTLIDSKLINLMSIKDSPLCNHLHISLQSGSNRILKLMNRKYNIEYFLDLIEKLRKSILDLNITTDVIVGFPSESYSDFMETVKVVEQAKFSKVHIFPYSDRAETASYNMEKKVTETTKKQRVKELLEFSNKVSYNVKSSYIGKEVSVLLESKGTGFSRNYLRVVLSKEDDIYNTGNIVSTKITSADEKFLYG